MSYSDKLKDPRWQKKRYHILHRDHGRCVLCDERKYLHVHHKKYIEGKNPWDYPDELLITICINCHRLIHRLAYSYVTTDTYCGVGKISGDEFIIIPITWFSDPLYNK